MSHKKLSVKLLPDHTLAEAVKGTQLATNHLLRFIDYIGEGHGHLECREGITALSDNEKYLNKILFQELLEFVLDRISNTNIADLIERQAMLPVLVTLKHIKSDNYETIRAGLLESEDGFLKAASLFRSRIHSSNNGTYRENNFEYFKIILEMDNTREELTQKIENAIRSSTDDNLKELVSTALNHANDPMM